MLQKPDRCVSRLRADHTLRFFLKSGLPKALCNRSAKFDREPVELWMPAILALLADGLYTTVGVEISEDNQDLWLVRTADSPICPACRGDGRTPDKTGGGHHGTCSACGGSGWVTS